MSSLTRLSALSQPLPALSDIAKERERRRLERERERIASDIEGIRSRCLTLAGFVREAWPNIPALANVPYVHGWHIDFIAAHLEAITFGRLLALNLDNRLLVNVPPGAMKSLLVSVFWPAWEWAMGFAHYQYIVTSYREDYCTRDTSRMRDLVASGWYQSLWGDKVKLTQSGDTRIANTAGGWREGVPFGSLTGNRADRVIIDDPHSIDTAESETERQRATMRFRESVPLRLNDPKKSAIVLIMQRLHESDLSGVALVLKLGYVHVMLPMEFEPERRCVTPIGSDPRTYDGEMLFPERFPRETVDRDKIALGAHASAGQLQQRPTARAGGLFKRQWFVDCFIDMAPVGTRWVRHWDLAATKRKTAARTAGVKIGKTPEGRFVVGHVVTTQDEGAAVRKLIKLTAETDGTEVEISLPQDPGQAGKVQASDFVAMLAGFIAHAEPETGEKATRAKPFAAQCEGGNVDIVRGEWNEKYIDELCMFPGGTFKDQVDASSGAFGQLTKQLPGWGIMEFYRQTAAATQAGALPKIATMVRMRAAPGSSSVYGKTGKQYLVGADGVVEVEEEDVKPLLSLGFEQIVVN